MATGLVWNTNDQFEMAMNKSYANHTLDGGETNHTTTLFNSEVLQECNWDYFVYCQNTLLHVKGLWWRSNNQFPGLYSSNSLRQVNNLETAISGAFGVINSLRYVYTIGNCMQWVRLEMGSWYPCISRTYQYPCIWFGFIANSSACSLTYATWHLNAHLKYSFNGRQSIDFKYTIRYRVVS